MKFVWVPAINRFRRTETEAKKEKLPYEVVEFETDKDSLIDRFNGYEERIEALQTQLRDGTSSPALAPPPEQEPQQAAAPPAPADSVPVAPPPPPVQSVLDLGVEAFEKMPAITLAPLLLCGISRLATLGEEGFNALEQEQELSGAGHGFSRGVHILSFVAAGPQQLDRTLFAARKARNMFGR